MKFPGILILLAAYVFSADLFISEIHRDPLGAESAIGGGASHEFIELSNFGNDTLFIDSLYITDGTESDSMVPVNNPIASHPDCIVSTRFLLPGQTAVILDPDYRDAVTRNPSCRLPIAEGSVLYMCGDRELGGGGLASDEGVMFYKGTISVIDSILCFASDYPLNTDGKISLSSPVNREGVSLVPVSILFDTVVYDYCAASLTPGRCELMRNGWVVDWRLREKEISEDLVTCTIKCRKPGGSKESQKWWLYSDSSGVRKILDSGKIVSGAFTSTLLSEFTAGNFDLVFSIANTECLIDLSGVRMPDGVIRINELSPRTLTGEPEWFELVNTSSMTVNLSGWKFGNSSDTAVLSATDRFLEPGGFLVVTKDAEALCARYPGLKNVLEPPVWHTLDNYRDTLFLTGRSGFFCDIACFESAWFTKWENQSLERGRPDYDGLSSESWNLSVRATPGFPNSSLFWRTTQDPSMEIGPIPFTPDGDGKDDLLAVTLKVSSSSTVSLSIYSFDGRKVRTFSGPAVRKYLWDGKSDNGQKVAVGPFFVIAQIQKSGKSVMIRKKGVLWR